MLTESSFAPIPPPMNPIPLTRPRFGSLGKFRLRTVLVVPFIIPVLISTGLVGWLSFRSGQRTVNELASQLRGEIAQRVQEEVQRYLDRPFMVHHLNAQVFRQNGIDREDPDVLLEYFWEQTREFLDLGTIAYANERGEFVGVNPLEHYLVLSNEQTGRSLQRYAPGDDGKPRELLRERPNYDSRTRPWYQQAVRAGGPIWTGIEPSAIGQRLDISAVYPVYDRDRRFLGVLLWDIPVSGINQFLESLKIGKTGEAFILERNGLLVATSTRTATLIPGRNGEEPQRLPATESQNPRLNAALNTLIAEFGSLENIKQSQGVEFFVEGARHFLQVMPFQDDRGIDWLIFVTIPEADFMKKIHENTQQTVVLCLLALTVSISCGVAIAQWILRPILRVTRSSEEIANGQLDRAVYARGIIELEKLADSFNQMLAQLKASFRALEQANRDLRRHEQELASSKEQLEAVLNAVPGSISWINSSGTYLGVNRYLADSLNLDPEEMVGQKIGFAQNSHEYAEFMQQFLSSSDLCASQEIHIVVQGKPRYYLMVVQKYQQGTAAVSVGIDISEWRSAQQESEKLKGENIRMSAELEVTQQLQKMLLPKPEELTAIEGLEIAAFMESAEEVGGDYYDVLNYDGVGTIAIGDVTGHGLESGILMVMTQTAVRTLKESRETDPMMFLDTLNRTIYHNVQRMKTDKNLTLAVLNYNQGQVSISGQHEDILVIRADGRIERVDTMDLGLPIGLDEDITEFIAQVCVELKAGDGIVLYTDGITEAQNREKQRYGVNQLCDIITQHWHQSVEEIQQAAIADVREYMDGQKMLDDMTLVVIKQK
ncbi:SpoIIE family protein phosphatase [Laspinema olomoucense]|uniref:SpoIIE family protein phosphatase n=1 Tax=Laspinema olomoucense TaxID=3231600 RepID=UPI0021BAAF60|nr:SpoIIE family protein phosphatase [Laspinema sp. D3d]MCT7971382.1 SpoIIE family protein phosphatase [Laspinema sp. D3d]